MTVTSVITTDLALALVRAVVGLVIAAHGAQKVLGVWGGPSLAGWTQGMTRMGMRPAAFWAWVSAFAELAGGIAFALGLLLPVVAAALTIQMAVAIARAHWSKASGTERAGSNSHSPSGRSPRSTASPNPARTRSIERSVCRRWVPASTLPSSSWAHSPTWSARERSVWNPRR